MTRPSGFTKHRDARVDDDRATSVLCELLLQAEAVLTTVVGRFQGPTTVPPHAIDSQMLKYAHHQRVLTGSRDWQHLLIDL